MSETYNLTVIRDLLLAAFSTGELRRFCWERSTFQPVLRDVPDRPTLYEIVDQVLRYCQEYHLFESLLAGVEQANPRQYARFASRLREPYTPLPTS